MSRINQLIRELCPEGVEFRTLGEVADIRRGTSITKPAVIPGDIPVIAGGRTPAYFHNVSNREGQTIVIAGSGAYAGFVSWWDQPIFVSDAFSIKPHDVLLAKYCYYWLTNIQEKLHELKTGGGVPHVYPRDVSPLRIPIPPLEIQREIVKVLDTFTKLEAELEAELEARRRQYQYYRDALLSFNQRTNEPTNQRTNEPPREKIRWLMLGEIAQIVRGASPRPIQSFLTKSEDGVPWIKIGDVPTSGKYITCTAERVTSAGAEKSRRVHPGDFVLSNSMSFGRPYISKIEGCIHDGWLAISNFSASFVPDFLYHLLRSAPVQAEFARRAGGGTVQNLNADIVKSILVPIPPLPEQARIVAILDKFDALVNDISIGLPAEIAARRKQYEYYRNRLLTFKEAA